MTSDSFIRQKKRFDHFPFQVQAYRGGQWTVISCHISAANGQRGLARIRKCQPGMPHLYRMVHCTDDDYIWVNPANKQKLAS
jgi:hypothetical protein